MAQDKYHREYRNEGSFLSTTELGEIQRPMIVPEIEKALRIRGNRWHDGPHRIVGSGVLVERGAWNVGRG